VRSRGQRFFVFAHHFAVRLDRVAVGLGFVVRGLDHFPVHLSVRALGLGFGFRGHAERTEEGSGERRRELQHVGQRGLRIEREPEPERAEQQLQLQLVGPAEVRVEVTTAVVSTAPRAVSAGAFSI